MVIPDYKSFLQLSRDASLIPVAKTLSADLLTPVGAFLSLAAKQKYAFLLPSSSCLPHTVQSLGHAFPALCRAHVRWNDVLLSLRPSLPRLRSRLPFLVRLVHGYDGTVRLLLYVHVRRSV